MSSNAFARSRPRVRHQRMPKASSSCDHPRFLQLVNELGRINDLKRKQEEADSSSGPSSSNSSSSSSSSNCSSGSCSSSSSSSVNDAHTCYQTPASSSSSGACCTGPGSNVYKSLDNNQQLPASTSQDNYQHQHQSLGHHQQQAQHQNNSSQSSASNSTCPHHPESCHNNNSTNDQLNICKPSTSFGYSKQNQSVDQQQANPDFSSDNHSNLRQDENRSKRKRSSLDTSPSSSSSKQILSSCKRHKSSLDTARPLSPSLTKCPICLLDCMDRDPSFTNTCFHLFCYVCIENWTKNKATCPLCRTKFSKIIFNIKSTSVYDEKTVSPIRRDDDDGYITDPLMLEHLTGLNPNSAVSNSRNVNNNDGVQFLFENLRNTEVLVPPYFVNQLDPHRHGESSSLHSFNPVTATASFNSSVPHTQFAPTSYPLTPNYIALFPPSRIAPTTTNTAIASAYGANTSLAGNLNTNDSNTSGNSSSRRVSRSGRYIYTRNYEFPNNDGPARMSRNPNIATINIPTSVAEVRHHHQHQAPHQHKQPPNQHNHHHSHHHHHHQQHHHQHSNPHRSTLDMSSRSSQNPQSQHAHIPLPYPYTPNSYPRRPFNSPQVDQQFLDTLYRQMPEM